MADDSKVNEENLLKALKIVTGYGGLTKASKDAKNAKLFEQATISANAKDDPELQNTIAEFAKLPANEQYDAMKSALEQQYKQSLLEESDKRQKKRDALLINAPAIPKPVEYLKDDLRYVSYRAGKYSIKEEIESKTTEKVYTSPPTGVTEYVKNELQKAISFQSTAKAVTADRAFTGVSKPLSPNGVTLQLTLQGYRKVDCPINSDLLTADAVTKVNSNNIVLIESGALVGDVEDHYWPTEDYDSLTWKDGPNKGKPYHALPNRGGYTQLSVVGLASVGAMGFSNNYKNQPNQGALQQSILSLRLVAYRDGAIQEYQIEPLTNAIHNSDAKAKLAAQGVTLIQNDDTFSDVITSVGTFGVITHAYITLVDAFYLAMYRKKVTLDEWETEYNALCNDQTVYSFECWYNPYEFKIGQITIKPSMLASIWRKHDGPPDNQEYIVKYGGVNRGSMPLWAVELSGLIPQIGAVIGCKDLVAFALNLSLDAVKITAPPRGTDKESYLVMSCIEAVDFGTANLVPNITGGNAFKIEDSIKAVNGYFNWLNSDANKLGLIVSVPPALRFAAQSYGSISCAGEYNVGWIEQPLVTVGQYYPFLNIIYALSLFKDKLLLEASRVYFYENFNGKIHWGLWFPEDLIMDISHPWFGSIGSTNMTSFLDNYKYFNNEKLFSNGFTLRSWMDLYAFK